MESERSFEDTNPASHDSRSVCFNVSISSSRLVVSSKVAAYGKSSKPIKRLTSCLCVCEFLTVAFILLWVWKFQPFFMGILPALLSSSSGTKKASKKNSHCFWMISGWAHHHLASLKLGVFFFLTWIQLSSETTLFFICPLNTMSYFRNSLRKHLCKFYESMFHIKSFTSKPPKTNNNLFRLLVFFGSRSPRLVAWDAPLVHQEPFDKPIVLRVLRSLTLKT